MYKNIIRPLLFKLDPESAHHLVTFLLKFICKLPFVKYSITANYSKIKYSKSVSLFGLEFPNCVGLAAGFDKDALLIDELSCFGFGFIEIGTLTPKAQNGNPKPRMFRLPLDKALINRMGFNNKGVAAAVKRLSKRTSRTIVGGNIGKNKNTSNDDALSDYLTCFEQLYDHVDYFTVNISSPNTPNLRALQEKEPLQKLLSAVSQLNIDLARRGNTTKKPILLKIAPDLSFQQLDEIIEIVEQTKIDGIVATNTSIDRSGLSTDMATLENIGAGGLSGLPLKKKSTEIVAYLHNKTGGRIPIIAVGGIYNAADAREKLQAGASLVQIYTGFIYEGPAIVRNILKDL